VPSVSAPSPPPSLEVAVPAVLVVPAVPAVQSEFDLLQKEIDDTLRRNDLNRKLSEAQPDAKKLANPDDITTTSIGPTRSIWNPLGS
jgi:hypothetical protein